MGTAVFVDTSVLLNVLDVPRRNADRAAVVGEFKTWQEKGATFVLPVTSILETGNEIAQIAGAARRRYVEQFVAILALTVAGTAPWSASGAEWDAQFVEQLVHGSAAKTSLAALLTMGIGVGDAGILAEIERYRSRVPSATPIVLWTLDTTLKSYSPT